MQRMFRKQYKSFIEEIFKVEFSTAISLNSSVPSTSRGSMCQGRGRPKLSYEDCSIRSKRRHVRELRCNYDQEAFSYYSQSGCGFD